MTTSRLCAVDVCKMHAPDCSRDPDDGCPPAAAAPGSRTCGHHIDVTRDLLRELPELWTILGARPQVGRSVGGGSDEPAEAITAAARDARDAVRGVLLSWSRVLRTERAVPLPAEAAVAGDTRQEVLRHQRAASAAMTAYRKGGPGGPAARRALLVQAHTARGQADATRETRETGADLIEALREHIDRHLAWLLASEHADQVVHDVRALHRACTGAIPGRGAAIRILCDCGGRVPITADSGAIIRCPDCNEWGTLQWWRQREAPTLDGPLPLAELASWLFAVHALVVSSRQLRTWRDRGYLTSAAADPVAGSLGRPPHRYDPEAVAIVARARLAGRATG